MPSFGSAGGFIRLAPYAAPAPRLASASGLHRLLSPSAFTGREPLGLRLVAPSPAGPLMHSLFQLNLASPAKPSMSIPFPPALASSGIFQLNNFRLASAFASSGASSDPSAACASGFTLCPGWRPSSGSHRLSTPSTLLAINFRLAPTVSSSSFRQPTPMPFRVIS